MSSISRGHVLAKVSHVGRITLRDMSALRVIFDRYCAVIASYSSRSDLLYELFSGVHFGTVLRTYRNLLFSQSLLYELFLGSTFDRYCAVIASYSYRRRSALRVTL